MHNTYANKVHMTLKICLYTLYVILLLLVLANFGNNDVISSRLALRHSSTTIANLAINGNDVILTRLVEYKRGSESQMNQNCLSFQTGMVSAPDALMT